jgi:hypothetical protein
LTISSNAVDYNQHITLITLGLDYCLDLFPAREAVQRQDQPCDRSITGIDLIDETTFGGIHCLSKALKRLVPPLTGPSDSRYESKSTQPEFLRFSPEGVLYNSGQPGGVAVSACVNRIASICSAPVRILPLTPTTASCNSCRKSASLASILTISS